ncbi:MAG: hypothetical protein K1X75_16405 [Leptospirales bacterium]|nr:hypothetical protein [Leptospirales bacterium]
MKLRSLARVFALTALLPAAGACQTVESYFQTVHIAVGLESASVRFYTNKPQLVEDFGYKKGGDEEGVLAHSRHKQRSRGFYNVSSQPQRLEFLKDTWIYPLVALQLTLNSPRTYRGVLDNYPDDGRVSQDPQEALSILLLPRQGVFARRMDYLYEEAQAYGTLYLGYFGDDFQIALGLNWGQAYYSLLIAENRVVVTDTRSHWRPVFSQSFILAYRLGKHFDSGLFSNTHIFLESVTELSSRHAVQTQLKRSDGSPPDALYVNSAVFRIGIRKQVELFESEAPAPPAAPSPAEH